jgi:hypothetical protein
MFFSSSISRGYKYPGVMGLQITINFVLLGSLFQSPMGGSAKPVFNIGSNTTSTPAAQATVVIGVKGFRIITSSPD